MSFVKWLASKLTGNPKTDIPSASKLAEWGITKETQALIPENSNGNDYLVLWVDRNFSSYFLRSNDDIIQRLKAAGCKFLVHNLYTPERAIRTGTHEDYVGRTVVPIYFEGMELPDLKDHKVVRLRVKCGCSYNDIKSVMKWLLSRLAKPEQEGPKGNEEA